MLSKTKVIVAVVFSLIISPSISQDKTVEETLPYEQIPENPENYSSGNVLGRMIDGLGYRYYWATEGLTVEDLKYRPVGDGRSLEETITHIYGLSLTIFNAPKNEPNVRPADWSGLSFDKKRALTLDNLKKASELLKASSPEDIDGYQVIFQNGDRSSSFPYWNMINGPIADAIYHTGQVVVLRRSAGNPINPKVNVFIGKTRD